MNAFKTWLKSLFTKSEGTTMTEVADTTAVTPAIDLAAAAAAAAATAAATAASTPTTDASALATTAAAASTPVAEVSTVEADLEKLKTLTATFMSTLGHDVSTAIDKAWELIKAAK